ncbi:MAG TPA: tetratricopeptide repeat protein, partial [Bacteroidota bacterium]|nr:tetratricopeptide repeat protein [Bacteroidota bacterium]
MTDSTTLPHRMLSTQKRVIFSLLPAACLALILILVEVSLRLFAPSLDSPLVREISVDSTAYYQVNRGYLEKYFPANAALIPEIKPSIIRKTKAANTYRVFCIGESSMAGTPYEFCATIPALIRKQLRHLLPDREIEVVNFGASAINSNVIADLAPKLAALHPDVVLIYTGHNEFYGPDGVGASWIEKRFPSITRWKYHARDLRLIRLAQRALARVHGAQSGAEKNLMKEVSKGALVRLNTPDASRVFSQFTENFQEILRTFHAAGIAVIASDISSNLMFPPFAFPERSDEEEVIREYTTSDFRSLEGRLEAERAQDSSNAFIDYWLGRTLLAQGNAARAAALLRQAKDEDLLKFRAPGEINAIIKSVCREESTSCLSADSLLRANSPSGITNQELFWEHLHPNVRGYDLIARMFVQEMQSLGLLGASDSHAALLPFNPDSLSLCWLDLAYGEISIKGLTGRWPFTDFHAPSPLLDSANAPQRRLILDLYTKKIGWPDACLKSAEFAEHDGRTQEAARTYEAMIEEYPFEYFPHYRLALLYKSDGNIAGAETAYRRCLALNPNYLYALIDLGLIQNNEGRFDDARTNLTAALTLTTQSTPPILRAQIFYGLAAVSANTGDIARAVQQIRES